ncbi:MAG: phosphate signaling complex protein PhoU [Pseudomonadales bacterium]
MGQHISEQFDIELGRIRDDFMEMAGLVEAVVRDAVNALVHHDTELAQQVRERDAAINRLEVTLDDLCVHTIAKRQPAASDLRMIISIMKACTDLERVGDEAGKIAKMAHALAEGSYPRDQYADFRVLADLAQNILSRSLDAFARRDADAALAIAPSDRAINELYKRILHDRTEEMRTDPANVDRALNIIWAARALERVGDHAKNLCEYLIYQVRGDDIRHAPKPHST